jgi:D-threonate/D-erythronate kinase
MAVAGSSPHPASAPTLLVLADDMTGAADVGVQLAARDIPTLVTLEPIAAWRDAAASRPVLVASTDSRHLAPAQAAARVREAVAWARDAGVPSVYKKIDSTLRGNLGAELEACLRASGVRVLPLLPAFPAMGRTTRGGRVYVHGRPLEQTTFAHDPLEPAGDGDVAAEIGRQTSLATWNAAVPLDETSPPHDGILIVDAENDDDLARAGRWLALHGLLRATAGSSGFAAQLPDLLRLRPSQTETTRYPERMLVVCGSVNDVALAQADRAAADGLASVRVTPELLLADDPCAGPAFAALAAEVRDHERHGRSVLLRTAADRRDLEASVARGGPAGLGAGALLDAVAENVGRIAGVVLDRTGFELIGVVGGDTLRAVARALGWRGLRPLREVVPGVPISATVGGRGPRLVVSKPGGFGPPDILAHVMRALRASAT